MPQPGWYPFPDDPQKLAFWDGSQWTGELMDQPSAAPAPVLSRRELRQRRSEEGEGVSMAFPTWEQRPEAAQVAPAEVVEPETALVEDELPADLMVEPVWSADPVHFETAEEVPQDWSGESRTAEAADVVFPVLTEAPQYPTEAVVYPTIAGPVPTEATVFPTVVEPAPTEAPVMADALPVVADEQSSWSRGGANESDDEFDAVLGVKPEKQSKAKKVKEPRQPKEKKAREPKPETTEVAVPSEPKGWKQPGIKSGLISAAVGIVLALIGMLLVPALLDPTPAGGAVQPGEDRATAVVRELNIDVDGYCHPTVEVPTGFGSFEVLALQLHELNTACPVKVGESVTVYYSPNSGEPARYVRAGSVPVDFIMWSVFGLGMGVAAGGLLRAWATRKGVHIPWVAPNR